MSLQRKILVIALASVMPLASAHAQSAADLQKEIAALTAQLQALQKKVEALSTATPAGADLAQQVTRIEQKQELAEAAFETAGLKGLKLKGTIEAAYVYDDLAGSHTFAGRDGNGGTAMIELTKETEDGQGVNWTLRLTPGAANLIHEATVSVGLGDGTRVLGGLIPDYQGYEGAFANLNPMLSHNALFDLAGPTSYTGLGMTHQLGKEVALKWMVGNIDGANDTSLGLKQTAGLAYRFDWTVSEYTYLGLSGAHASTGRAFDVVALDGGYVRGDWLLNGHLNFGQLKGGAYNGGDASWTGLSGLLGYKLTPRLQLLARADFIENSKNGGGTYVSNYFGQTYDPTATPGILGGGLGPELDKAGALVDAANPKGANLTRLSLGTNYLLNATTQWKTEVRLDQSTGNNFQDESGAFKKNQTTLGTAVVVSF